MPIGLSGRIVIEVDPEFKQQLYAALDKDQLTLKEWFLRNAQDYLTEAVQPSLALFDRDQGRQPTP
jgi:hypothetical protein